MKRFFCKLALISAMSLSLVGPSWAIVIDDTNAGLLNGSDVGVLDIFVKEDVKQGNPTSEADWANTYLDPDTTYDGWKTEDVDYFKTDVAGVFAFELVSSPGYYIIKNAKRVALFENVASLDWGVFSISDLSDDMKIPDFSEMQISHVTELGSWTTTTTTTVPEPGTLALLSLGLLGFGFSRRKTQQ